MLTQKLAFCLVAFVAVGDSCAEADVIYNNFGPGDSYSTSNNGWGVQYPVDGQIVGVPFTPTETVQFDDLTAAFTFLGGSGSLDVFLQQDAAGAPGTILESFSTSNGFDLGVITFDSVLRPALSAGTTYWIVAEASSPGANYGWRQSLSDTSTMGDAFNGTWITFSPDPYTTPVLRIDGAQVPEPGSLPLIGAGLFAFAVIRRLKPRGTVVS
jgi:hypothetical protein